MKKIINFFENIPTYVINAITVISFVAMPLSFLGQLILIWFNKIEKFSFNWVYVIIIAAIVLISFAKIKKYHSLSYTRMKVLSVNFSDFLKRSQTIYFDVMKLYKEGHLSLPVLKDKYETELVKILDCLCNIMQNYTGRDIKACIKIINYDNPNNQIDINKATVSTLCRSSNSTDRGDYEVDNEPIYIKRNTDFREIVDETINTGKPYFYVRDLGAYAKLLKKSNRKYENSNKDYMDYYTGTIVMPIRIETKKLYNIQKKEKYDVIGFLCVDSTAPDAFMNGQEVFNCNIVRAFADNIYVLLGQYAHYLKKF